MSQFDSVSLAPADPILSLSEAFKADPNPEKINLSVGQFVNESGITPILETVHDAEKTLAETASTKGYLPIAGSANYAKLTQNLCYGDDRAESLRSRLISVHTPGGTGALRVAADFVSKNLSGRAVWVSTPTWANHKGVFAAAGLEIKNYAYFDHSTLSLDYDSFIASIKEIPAGDMVVLHACCHNPTGADLTPEQWDEVVSIASSQGWIPLIDFAYQGFGTDIETDAHAPRALADAGITHFVAQSFSKNIGLYRERVGALHVLTDNEDETARALSQVKIAIRCNFSNPPAHGGAIVETVLGDESLKARWVGEVAAMRNRIHGVRRDFVEALAAAGAKKDFSFLIDQKGMFSFTGLSKEQAIELREKHSIYIVESGRINVAGITSKNLGRLASVIASIL